VESANDQDLSMLLAIEAVETTRRQDGIVTQEATDALLAALGRRAEGAALPIHRYRPGISAFPDGIPFVSHARPDSAKRVLTLDIAGLLPVARAMSTRSFTAAECRRFLHVPACPEQG
jgi:hypothetical protein